MGFLLLRSFFTFYLSSRSTRPQGLFFSRLSKFFALIDLLMATASRGLATGVLSTSGASIRYTALQTHSFNTSWSGHRRPSWAPPINSGDTILNRDPYDISWSGHRCLNLSRVAPKTATPACVDLLPLTFWGRRDRARVDPFRTAVPFGDKTT